MNGRLRPIGSSIAAIGLSGVLSSQSACAQTTVTPVLMEGWNTPLGVVKSVRSVEVTPDGVLHVGIVVRAASGESRDALWGGVLDIEPPGILLGLMTADASDRLVRMETAQKVIGEQAVWGGLMDFGGCGTHGAVGRLDSIGRGSSPLAIEQHSVPWDSTQVWRDLGRTGATLDGGVSWLGGYSAPGYGIATGRALLFNDGQQATTTRLLMPGQLVTGFTPSGRTIANVRSGTISWDASSAMGVVETQDATGSHDCVVSLDASIPLTAVVKIASKPLMEGSLVGGRGARSGERWTRVSQPLMVQSPDELRFWAMVATTDAVAGQGTVVAVGGTGTSADGIAFREGQILAGLAVQGPAEHLCGNAAGNLAVVWRTQAPSGAVRKALFVDAVLAMSQDDQVPLGNGEWGRMANFPGQRGVAMAGHDGLGRARVFVVASVEPDNSGSAMSTGTDGRVGVLYEVRVPSSPSVTWCAADFNGLNGLSLQDLFDFLGAYFAGDIRADFSGDGVLGVQDIFGYLTAYFTGC